MPARPHRISPPARQVLRDWVRFDGPRVAITEKLGHELWQEVKLVMHMLGAVYVIGESSFDFEADQDAESIVEAARSTGTVMAAANAEGFVPTPADLAEDIIWSQADLYEVAGREARVLEPSAGSGAFVRELLDFPGMEHVRITAIEPNARRARYIPTSEQVSLHVTTFEAWASATDEDFDRIVMNPPFSALRHPSLWAEHLLLAWRRLAPGGRLVSIVPISALHPSRLVVVKKASELIHLHGEAQPLEADAFAESGFRIATALVMLDRPIVDPEATPPPRTWHPSVFRRYASTDHAVPVSRPLLTRGAAATMPVQLYWDVWRNASRTLHYLADCVVCTRPVWGFTDGENDPRGPLGHASAGWSLDPEGYEGWTGPSVGLCAVCGNERVPSERGLKAAKEIWRDVAERNAKEQQPELPAGQLALDIR